MLTRTVHEKGLSLNFLYQHLPLLILATFVIGRVANIWSYWDYFVAELTDPSWWEKVLLFFQKFIYFWHGGLDVFWSAIGFLLVFFILIFRYKENLWKWLDAFSLPTILLITFWSLGAFFSAWNYGKPVSDSFLFGVTYDVQEVRYSLPLHPVQIYAFLYFGALFVAGWRAWSKNLFQKEGTFFGITTLLVFLGNGLLEFFRGDPTLTVDIGGVELRTTQLMSFIFSIIFVFFLIIHTHPDILHAERKKT